MKESERLMLVREAVLRDMLEILDATGPTTVLMFPSRAKEALRFACRMALIVIDGESTFVATPSHQSESGK